MEFFVAIIYPPPGSSPAEARGDAPRAVYLPTAARHCRVTSLKTQKNVVAFLTVIGCLHVSPALAVSNKHCDR